MCIIINELKVILIFRERRRKKLVYNIKTTIVKSFFGRLGDPVSSGRLKSGIHLRS